MDLPAIENAVRTILKAVGEDPDRPGLIETPRRVAKMYAEMFSGLHVDPARHLEITFPEIYDEILLVRDIQFSSMCEHHLLPFTGVAHVAYLPGERLLGLSKLARVVELHARRPQVQERLTQQVADWLHDALGPRGVGVVVEAHHQCMSLRGVRTPATTTVTAAFRGALAEPGPRAELLALAGTRPDRAGDEGVPQ